MVFTFWSRSDCESAHEFVITTKRKLSANDQESVQVEHQVEHQATNEVTNEATNQVNGASVAENKRKAFKLSKPVQAIFQKNGKVKIAVSINLKKGENANDTCLKIQERIASVLMAYTESVPFDIQINIVEIE